MMSEFCLAHRPVKGFSSLEATPRYAPDLHLEPTHLEIHAHLHIPEAAADCRVITTVKSRGPGHRSLSLDAIGLQIEQVEDPDGHGLDWDYDGSRVRLSWHDALEAGTTRRVEIRYRVESPLTGLYFQSPDAEHPDRAVLAVTDHETERARYWLPCMDHPAVRTHLDLHIRSLDAHEILATGAEISSHSHGDGTRTVHWRLERPCPAYLVCMAVGEMVRQEGGEHRGRPIAFFAPSPYSQQDLERSFGPTSKMLDWITNRLGAPLPYPKYFQFASPGIGGAMENISLVSWGDLWVADECFREEMGWLIDIINVHEMAHTWFGDAVVIRDYAHAWLKESWASYMEIVWQEEQLDIDTAHHHLAEKARAYCTESDERYARPIVTRHFDSAWDMYDRHLYPGGAWRLHMLRHLLGEEVFWAAVSDYVEKYTDRVVETADFRRLLEEHSGQSLARFFDEWIHRPGYPKLKITYSHDSEKGRARLVLEQTQEDKSKDIGLFHFPLEIAVEEAEGSWTRHHAQIDGKRQVLSWNASARALQIVIDPDQKTLFSLDFDPGMDMLERSLQAPTVSGRIRAATALAKQGRDPAIAALEKAWQSEKHWGVRDHIARSLGDANTFAAAGALARILLAEKDPKVMLGICIAAGQYRDERIGTALETWLKRDGLPYRACAEGLISLGKQRKEVHLPTLQAFSRDDGWWGWVRRGALLGLGQSRLPIAVPQLLGVAANISELEQIRTAAVQALSIHCTWQDRALKEQICEVLCDLCRDPIYNIRQAAGQALIGAGDLRHAHALETLCTQLALQDVPSIRRGIARLGPGSELSKTRTLEDMLTRLNERMLKLQNRIEDLESERSNQTPGTSAPEAEGT